MDMDASTLWPRGAGPPPYPNVMDIPTPPLQRTAIFIMFMMPALSAVIYGLRIYARVTLRTVGLDDWLVGLALISSILVSSSLFMFFKLNYYGWPDEDVPDFDPGPGLWFNFFEQLCYNPVLALVKVSILVFLLRLGGHHNTLFKVIWALITVTILHAIAVFFGALFQCVPIKSNWNPELKEDPSTKCIDNSFHIIQSSLTILTDLLILALPFWIFLGLRMPRAAKLAVLGVFAVGLFVPVVAIIRLINLYRLLYLGQKSKSYNIAYVWTAVEVNLAIMCCCMPALRPLFSRMFPKLFGSGDKSTDNPYPVYPGTGGASTNVTSGGASRSHNRESHSRNYMLKDLHPTRKVTHTEIRGDSPTGSEEEIMTYNGILRTTNFNVKYEDAKAGEPSDTGSNISRDIS